MNLFQPIQDTYSVLAGGAVRRTTRPSEKLEIPEQRRTSRSKWTLIRGLILSILPKAQM